MIRIIASSLFLILLSFNLLAQNNAMVTLVTIKTKFGEAVVYLYDETPKHKANFIKLAKEGFYNGTKFHRVINNFMIQGGDPNSKDADPANDGQGGPGYTVPAEILPTLTHKYGTLAAARTGGPSNPNRESSGSQFYIVNNKSGTPHLNGEYTVYGLVLKGMEMVEAITADNKSGGQSPASPVEMTMTVSEMKKADFEKAYPAMKK